MPLIHLHIPKTAGMALRAAFEAAYDPWRRVEVYQGQFGKTVFDPEFVDAMVGMGHALDLVHGHFSFGAHRNIGCAPIYSTVLRHPVERVVSLYRHLCRQEEYLRHYRIHFGIDLSSVGIAGFVERRLTDETNNHQVRILTGGVPKPAFVDDEALVDLASARIAREFVVVALQECDPIGTMAKALGWTIEPPRGVINAAPDRPAPLDEQTRAIIERHNRLDLLLYERVRRGEVCANCRAPAFRAGPELVRFPNVIRFEGRSYALIEDEMAGFLEVVEHQPDWLATDLRGWACRPHDRSRPVAVVLFCGMKALAASRPLLSRSDVVTAHADATPRLCGWEVRLPGEIPRAGVEVFALFPDGTAQRLAT